MAKGLSDLGGAIARWLHGLATFVAPEIAEIDAMMRDAAAQEDPEAAVLEAVKEFLAEEGNPT